MKARRWRVRRVPVGPEVPAAPRPIVFEGTEAEALAEYAALCERTSEDGYALVVVDGFDRVVYAAS